MVRVLLALVMIAEVAACPYRCAAAEAIAPTAVRQVERSCSCCPERGSSQEPSVPSDTNTVPSDPNNDCDCCVCFCDGSANTGSANITPLSLNSHSIWIAVADPVAMPMALPGIALEHGFHPPGEHSGRGMRLAVQSLLL